MWCTCDTHVVCMWYSCIVHVKSLVWLVLHLEFIHPLWKIYCKSPAGGVWFINGFSYWADIFKSLTPSVSWWFHTRRHRMLVNRCYRSNSACDKYFKLNLSFMNLQFYENKMLDLEEYLSNDNCYEKYRNLGVNTTLVTVLHMTGQGTLELTSTAWVLATCDWVTRYW